MAPAIPHHGAFKHLRETAPLKHVAPGRPEPDYVLDIPGELPFHLASIKREL